METIDYCFELESSSDNALAIKIKNDIVDKLLVCSTKSEVKDVLNGIIADNYDSLDIEKVRTGPAQLGPVLDSFLVCSLEESTENLPSTTQIQVGNLLKNAIDLICKPPSFEIPSPFPIIDVSGAFLEQLKVSLLKLAVKILVAILKKLLELIMDVCTGGTSLRNFFGSFNIDNAISSIDSALATVGENINSEIASYTEQVFAVFGVDSNGLLSETLDATSSCNEIAPIDTTIIKTTTQFLDDMSSVLTPLEICNLFEGIPDDQTFQVIEELMRFEHPTMGVAFNNRTKIKDLFLLLGKKVDPSICKAVRDNAETIIGNPSLCFTEDGNELRSNLLREKGSSEEEIQQLLDKERFRQQANLKKVSEILANIKTDPNKLFGEQQDIFCKGGQPGIVSFAQMPSLQTSIDRTVDYIYNLFTTTFFKEIDAYGSLLVTLGKEIDKEDPVIPKFINLSIQDKDGKNTTLLNTINPEFSQKTSFGAFTLCDDEGKSDAESLSVFYKDGDTGAKDDNENVDIQKAISVTSKKDAKKYTIDGNIYIVRYKGGEKLVDDLYSEPYGLFNERIPAPDSVTFFSDLVSYKDTGSTIEIIIPTKYASLWQEETIIPDFQTIPSTDKITINIAG